NILIRWDPDQMLKAYFSNDKDYATFLESTRLMWMNLDFDAGRPFVDGIDELVAAFPHYEAPLRAFDTRWSECVLHAIEDNVATLKALKQAGHTVHAITNFSREKFDVARARFPFLDLFDHALVSGDVGVIKPDYRIYHRFVRDVGLRPEELIFVDDSAVNIAAAKSVGYQVFHMPHADAAECEGFREVLREGGFSFDVEK
ncbi:MAG: HAD family hydrolase, partial [Bosea sp. (in: a-proteobacteria)]